MSRSFIHFSASHLDAANQFALAARELEVSGDKKSERQHRSFVLGAIGSAVAFLEAEINQLFLLAAGRTVDFQVPGLSASDALALSAAWDACSNNLPMLAKYELALAVCRAKAFDKGRNPYQDVVAVTKLRNAVIHYCVPFREVPSGETSLEKLLKGKFSENPYTEKHKDLPNFFFFPSRCFSYGCARWATKSARSFADEFYRKLGSKPYYQWCEYLNINLPPL